MIRDLHTGLIGGHGHSLKLPAQSPEPVDAHSVTRSFQQYLNIKQGDRLPDSSVDLPTDAVQLLAASLLSAMDRVGMDSLFSDTDSEQGASPSSQISTDLFMAMRNHTMVPALAVQANASRPSVPQKSDPAPVQVTDPAAMIAREKPVHPEAQSTSGVRESYASMIESIAAANGLDPKLLDAVIQTESDFNAQAVSPVGAQGLMQLMPDTAADLGVKDAFDPEQNIQAGSKYLKRLMDRYDGNTGLALAAYNWGMGNLERHPERMPQETVNYVAKITGMMNNAA